MKNSEILHALIHSLSRSEKRYFKLYCPAVSSDSTSNYLLLFNALEKQKEYDAEALKRSLKKTGMVKNLASEKNYLYNLILESLLVYHKETPRIKISTMVNKAHLLYERGLVKASQKLLASAKKAALNYQDKSVQLPIVIAQIRSFYEEDWEAFDTWLNETDQLVDEISNVNQYLRILTKGLELWRRSSQNMPWDREELEELFRSKYMQDEKQAITVHSKVLFHHLWGLYYRVVKMSGLALRTNMKEMEVYDMNEGFKLQNLHGYMNSVSNALSSAFLNNDINAASELIKKLEALLGSFNDHITPFVQDNFRQLYFVWSLRVNAAKGDFDRSLEHLDSISTMLKEEPVMRPVRKLSIIFYTAYALFALKRYKETLRWIQQAETVKEYGISYRSALFLKLVTHYELDNMDVVNDEARWLQQFLLKQGTLTRVEELLCNCFMRMEKCDSNAERNTLLRQTLDSIKELDGKGGEMPVFIVPWMTAKITRRDFVGVVKEMSLAKQ